MNLAAPWSELCDVDVSDLLAWLQAGNGSWSKAIRDQPRRQSVPIQALPIIDRVLDLFPGAICHQSCLSMVPAGGGHGYHQDSTPKGWLTRVHVPLITNPGCWMMFASRYVHFQVGKAYSFNMSLPHAFGNDGETDRVHLHFDVQGPSGEG